MSKVTARVKLSVLVILFLIICIINYFGPFIVLYGIGIILLSGYVFMTYKFTYWHRRNVPFDPPEFPFGHLRKIFTKRVHFAAFFRSIYNKYPDEPFVGIYSLYRPALIIRDPDIIKAIFTTSFENFSSRGILFNPEADPCTFSILSVDASEPKWKIVNSKANEAFATGKIRTNMLKLMLQTGDDLNNWLKKYCEAGAHVELKSAGYKYGLDVIGATAFGVQCKSFEEAFNPYKELSTQLSTPKSLFGHMKIISAILVPKVMMFLGLSFCDKNVIDFFVHWYDSIGEQRRTTERSDWIGAMLELLRKREEGDTVSYGTILTKEEHIGNLIAMLEAGYESAASMVCFALYLLTMNPDIQEKARKEVKMVLDEHGEFTYEAVLDMNYVGAIIDETIRLFPPIPSLHRISTRSCELPNTKLTLEKDTCLIVPTYAMLRDPNIFPNPEKFYPERNHSQLGESVLSNLPFGLGPRTCPGKRYSLIQGRVAVAKVLSKFRLLPTASTPSEIEIDEGSLLLRSKVELWIKVEVL